MRGIVLDKGCLISSIGWMKSDNCEFFKKIIFCKSLFYNFLCVWCCLARHVQEKSCDDSCKVSHVTFLGGYYVGGQA